MDRPKANEAYSPCQTGHVVSWLADIVAGKCSDILLGRAEAHCRSIRACGGDFS